VFRNVQKYIHHTNKFYVGPRIPDMYPLHIGVLDMRDATLPLRTVTATTLLCFWQGRNKILKHITS
jgi:hypothetical protein